MAGKARIEVGREVERRSESIGATFFLKKLTRGVAALRSYRWLVESHPFENPSGGAHVDSRAISDHARRRERKPSRAIGLRGFIESLQMRDC